jgi:superfamily II DNA or RNA helicase
MINFDPEADAIGSFNDAMAEIGRRVKAGASAPTSGYFKSKTTEQSQHNTTQYAVRKRYMENKYETFLATKLPAAPLSGYPDPGDLNPALKPFQAAITRWALRRGRAAIFAGTGLGKTLMQLVWARTISDGEEFPTLILTPLAVAEQTVAEAAKFGIDKVAYALDQQSVKTDIVVTNYERFDKFRIEKFGAIVLDESGIIKSHDGATRAILTEACINVAWKLCCTATPAPNDYAELGQHAEFLGVMTAKEMLSMFFVHDGGVRVSSTEFNDEGWRLKRHATKDFWRWLASWSVMVRHPSDLGFDEPGYDLPPLRLEQITVAATQKPLAGNLFPTPANTLGERISVRKDTAEARVATAVDIVTREPAESWLIWCNLNSEADAIERMLPQSLQVAGRHSTEIKVERLLGFKVGDPQILISKPAIAGHGMNWQNCSKMIFVGLTDSFEQVYQAIRRCWRFGQTKPVDVYFIASELEGAVVANLRRKEQAFDAMLDDMGVYMRDLMRENVIGGRNANAEYNPTIKMQLPVWL